MVVRITLSIIKGLYQVQILPLRPSIQLILKVSYKLPTATFFTATKTATETTFPTRNGTFGGRVP
jgi:hypothetical protein